MFSNSKKRRFTKTIQGGYTMHRTPRIILNHITGKIPILLLILLVFSKKSKPVESEQPVRLNKQTDNNQQKINTHKKYFTSELLLIIVVILLMIIVPLLLLKSGCLDSTNYYNRKLA